MHRHRRLRVVFIEAAGSVAQKHHGKLKALGLVHRHYLHGVPRCAPRHVVSPLGKLSQPFVEAVQAAEAALFKALCKLQHKAQVRAAKQPVRHRGAQRHEVELIIYMPQQLARLRIRSSVAQAVERL